MNSGIRKRDRLTNLNAILEAAENLFSQKGFSGTSLKDIADKSGIPKGLIYHYFQKKKDIYTAVKKKVLNGYIEAQEKCFNISTPLDKPLIEESLRVIFQYYKETSNYRRLSFWALLEEDDDLWPGEADVLKAGVAKLENAQSEGCFPAKIEPGYFMMMVWGMLTYWLQSNERYRKILNIKTDIDILDEKYLKQVIEIIENGTKVI